MVLFKGAATMDKSEGEGAADMGECGGGEGGGKGRGVASEGQGGGQEESMGDLQPCPSAA